MDEFKDCVHTTARITLGYWDRVKVLFGAVIISKVRVKTEHEVGRTATESDVIIGGWRRRPIAEARIAEPRVAPPPAPAPAAGQKGEG